MDLWGRSEAGGRVGADARHVPFSGEIEDVAQQHQHAISGSGCVAVGPHIVDQLGDAVVGDLVERQASEDRQDVDSQEFFIHIPAPFGRPSVRQIPLADELRQRPGRSQFLATNLRIRAEQRFSHDRPTLTSRLLNAEHIGSADFELPLPAVRIDVSLIESLATRAADFEKKSSLLGIEESIFSRPAGQAASRASFAVMAALGMVHFLLPAVHNICKQLFQERKGRPSGGQELVRPRHLALSFIPSGKHLPARCEELGPSLGGARPSWPAGQDYLDVDP